MFYAAGFLPTATTRNLRKQVQLASGRNTALNVARHMFQKRFVGEDLTGKSLKEMMGMEGKRIRQLYEQKANEYGVGWRGRRFEPGRFEMGGYY